MIPFSSEDEFDPDQFLNKAKRLVMNQIHETSGGVPDVYIVWFSKTLQNWKALLSTSVADGRYYEVTYDGDKKRAYVDTYVKESNVAVED